MDTCQHCNYLEATRVLVWKYPGETYSLAAALCNSCAEQVRIRHARGVLVLREDDPLDELLVRQVRP